MDPTEFRGYLDKLIELTRTTLSWAEDTRRQLYGQTTTRPSDPRGPTLEPAGFGVAIDSIRGGQRCYIHVGPRGTYVSLSPEPSNVLFSPSIWDNTTPYNASHNSPTDDAYLYHRDELDPPVPSHTFNDYVQHFPNRRILTGDEYAERYGIHSDSCGRANGQCDCGAQEA